MIKLSELVTFANDLLEIDRFQDYCPNGLQIEGDSAVSKIVSGVTASQALVDAAVEAKADVLLVHHGYFWRGEAPQLTGIKGQRIKTLLSHGISLLAYHLPLDAHPVYGNNAQLAEKLDIVVDGPFGPDTPKIGLYGHFKEPISSKSLCERVSKQLHREPLHIAGDSDMIHSIAWCSGAAQSYLDLAYKLGVDAYISGEISEQTVHNATELGIHYLSCGHHATERYGVQALGSHLAAHLGVEHEFIDINNPV